MSDSDGAIEYLDEDADIVQQCVITSNVDVPIVPMPVIKSPLLVERKRRTVASSHHSHSAQKRRKDVDDDEDYDPRKNANSKMKRKSYSVHKKSSPFNRIKTPVAPAFSPTPKEIHTQKFVSSTENVIVKQKTEPKTTVEADKPSNEIVHVYDYRDPLCIRDEPFVGNEEEMGHIKDWNRLCYEQLIKHENPLMPDEPDTYTKKSLIFRNVCNNLTGKEVPTVWSRLTIRNQDGRKKSEGFESILPNFTTAKIDFEMSTPTPRNQKSPVLSSNCVILTKEEHKDGEVLVGYRPQEALAHVFKAMQELVEVEGKMSNLKYLEEKLQCKICTSCYQYSWRGARQEKFGRKQIKCGICSRGFINTYNFVSHLKVHSAEEVKLNKKALCKTLAESIGYHYKCRICQKNNSTIKEARKHMLVHKVTNLLFGHELSKQALSRTLDPPSCPHWGVYLKQQCGAGRNKRGKASVTSRLSLNAGARRSSEIKKKTRVGAGLTRLRVLLDDHAPSPWTLGKMLQLKRVRMGIRQCFHKSLLSIRAREIQRASNQHTFLYRHKLVDFLRSISCLVQYLCCSVLHALKSALDLTC
ncbi:hypothetical protein EVAR_101790_1 [Eumeta japonica]|uniref:C2H2-type domain-containing protein n=1 Tax=Eumeta variegata TaxID=151549 RepID=A0A4C1SQT2_EUMVA|nr:hypothetical protein EVAR_101790_1 [Eumeta japonica]